MTFRSNFSRHFRLPTITRLVAAGVLAAPSAVLAESGHGEGATSPLSISSEGTVNAARVVLELDHKRVEDLIVSLSHHPHEGNAKTVVVAEHPHDAHHLEAGIHLDDEFDGRPLSGTWTVSIQDHAFSDAGKLESWTLFLEQCDASGNCEWNEHHADHGVEIPDLAVVWNPIDMDAPLWTNKDAIFWPFFNFFILIGVVVFLGKAPIKSFLNGRRDRIQSDLLEARELREAAQKTFDTASEKLQSLERELESIRADMVKAGEEERARIVADAEKKASRMRKDASFLIEQQLKQLRVDLTQKTVQASIAAAKQAIGSSINDEDQRRLADDYLSRVKDIGGSADVGSPQGQES